MQVPKTASSLLACLSLIAQAAQTLATPASYPSRPDPSLSLRSAEPASRGHHHSVARRDDKFVDQGKWARGGEDDYLTTHSLADCMGIGIAGSYPHEGGKEEKYLVHIYRGNGKPWDEFETAVTGAKNRYFDIEEVKAVIGEPASFRDADRLPYASDRLRYEAGQAAFNRRYLGKLQALVEDKQIELFGHNVYDAWGMDIDYDNFIGVFRMADVTTK